MRIAIHSQGDWNDAEITLETLSRMLAAGEMRFSGTDTGQRYGESESIPIYEADKWPGGPSGFDYISNAPDHAEAA